MRGEEQFFQSVVYFLISIAMGTVVCFVFMSVLYFPVMNTIRATAI